MTTHCSEMTVMGLSVVSANMRCPVRSFIRLSNCNAIRGCPGNMTCHIVSNPMPQLERLALQRQQNRVIIVMASVKSAGEDPYVAWSFTRSHCGPVISVSDTDWRAGYCLVVGSNCQCHMAVLLTVLSINSTVHTKGYKYRAFKSCINVKDHTGMSDFWKCATYMQPL